MKKFERASITPFELAEHKGYIDIKYILASSVPNLNGALFTKEELASAKETIINQPLIIVPGYENLPTGHSLEEFPKLSEGAAIIGTHIASEVVSEGEVDHLQTTARVWSIRHPEIAGTMKDLYSAGNLKFSMECSYASSDMEGASRVLRGVNFIGSAVVDDPANPFSIALEVANKKKEEKGMNLEQALEKIGQLEAAKAQLESDKTKLETELATVTSEKEALSTSLETANKSIDELNGKVSAFETEKAEAVKKELATKRFDEMAKYVEYKEEEKEAKMATFASMSEEVFNLLVETAKRNKPVENTDVAGVSSDTKLETSSKGFLDGIESL